MKCMERNQLVELVYIDFKGNISQRRLKVLRIKGDVFQVFCFKRNAKRTFIINSVLAYLPLIRKETYVLAKNKFSQLREITVVVGLKSISTAHGHLDRLRNKRYIDFINFSPRTLQIIR